LVFLLVGTFRLRPPIYRTSARARGGIRRERGQRPSIGFAADAHYLYFTWSEDDGDIWVMDVMMDVSK
jgi:hypothetical protein